MADIWYAIVAGMFMVFAILEGWDFGVGALHLVVARTPAERRLVVAAIGPLWVWHEVWLVGVGGVLLMVFPAVMAAAFSGFYLALYLVLWSLLLRGIALEFGGHLAAPLWRSFWDVVFAGASLLLALLFGVAMGNLLRGVPLDGAASFTMAFFTDFTPYGAVGILDWYTVSVGAATVVLLAAHGASYLALRTSGPVHDRSRRLIGWLWPAAFALVALVTGETMVVRPELVATAVGRPLVWLAALTVGAGLAALVLGQRRGRERLHFLGSVLILTGLLGGAFAALHPDLLHSTLGAEHSLTTAAGGNDRHGLVVALIWWPFSLVAAIGYVVFNVREHLGKVGAADDGPGAGGG